MDFDRAVSVLVAVTCVVGIIVGGLFIANHVSAGCHDFFFFKSCAVVTK